MPNPRERPASEQPRPKRQRSSADASNRLSRRNVGPLLSIVGGRKVDQPTMPPQRQVVPVNLSASPESSSGEAESPTPLPTQPVQVAKGSARKRKAAPSNSGAPPPRKARRMSPKTTPQADTESPNSDFNEDQRVIFASMKSSQLKKVKKYGSQDSHNIHAPSKSPKESESLREQKSDGKTSGFKQPRGLPENNHPSPVPTFKRPPALAESPRSSTINTFRTPRSSPPLGIISLTSSAPQLSDDDSPLSSPPPTPELEALSEGLPIHNNGIFMLPCPLCGSLVSQAFLETFKNGRSLRWTDKVAFCQAHKAQEAEVQRSTKQYPVISWPDLPSRMSKFHSTIEAVLERRMDSYYRNIIDESVTTGQERNAFRAVEGEGQANAVPGYYGLKGARLMQENILAAFSTKIRRLAGRDKAIPRTGPAGYVQTVLAPEMAVLLVMDDFPGIDAEKARSILAESIEVGKLIADNDDDTARS